MRVPHRAQIARRCGVLPMVVSAVVLSGCLSSASPPVNGGHNPPSLTVVRSNITRGNLNLYLSDLSCSSARDCWAIGQDTVQEGQFIPTYSLVMHYASDSWYQVLRTGNAQSTNPPQLGQLSCPTAGWCMTTVGYSGHSVGTRYPTFAVLSNGRIRLVSTASIAAFSAIDCRSKSDCVGVGQTPEGRFAAARWNGTTWAPMTVSGVNGYAVAVSCPAPTYCIAVGSSVDAAGQVRPGAMQWRGTAWRATPRPEGTFGTPTPCRGSCPSVMDPTPKFDAVSCTSATQCVALGSGSGSFGFAWNGATWTELPELLGAGLEALSCSPGGSCLAVGGQGGDGAKAVTIIGDSVSNASPPSSILKGRDGLNAVDCPSSRQCVVLGATSNSSSETEQIAASWNGSSWKSQAFSAPAFSLVRPDTFSEELGPCTSSPDSKVVTLALVDHRGSAVVSPTCQVVERGQQLDVRNATKASATAFIGTTFVFVLKPGETAQLRPALSDLFALGHHSLGFNGPNYGTFTDLWIGSRTQQPGYQLTVSSDASLSVCNSVKGGRTVAAYTARNEQLYRSFPWSTALNDERPLATMTLCVLAGPGHSRVLKVLNGSGASVLSTAGPASVVVERF